MSIKPTSIMITHSVAFLEKKILEQTMLSKTAFHRKAIDTFLNGDQTIDADLRIRSWTDPQYIKRTFKECIYLDDERRQKLQEVMIKENIDEIGTIIFQALINYCVEMSKYVPESELEKLLK